MKNLPIIIQSQDLEGSLKIDAWETRVVTVVKKLFDLEGEVPPTLFTLSHIDGVFRAHSIDMSLCFTSEEDKNELAVVLPEILSSMGTYACIFVQEAFLEDKGILQFYKEIVGVGNTFEFIYLDRASGKSITTSPLIVLEGNTIGGRFSNLLNKTPVAEA